MTPESNNDSPKTGDDEFSRRVGASDSSDGDAPTEAIPGYTEPAATAIYEPIHAPPPTEADPSMGWGERRDAATAATTVTPSVVDDASDKPERADEEEKRRSFWVELPFLIFFGFLIVVLLKAFVVQAFFIPSGSMENTLAIGDGTS